MTAGVSTRTIATFDLNNCEGWSYTGTYEVNRDNISHLRMTVYGTKVLESPVLELSGLDSIGVNVVYSARNTGFVASKLALTVSLKDEEGHTTSKVVPAIAGVLDQNMVAVLPVEADAARLSLAALKADIDNCAAVRSVTVTGYMKGITGDVTGDGTVDVSDINYVINAIIGTGFDANADVNGDGTVDVSDINMIINIMLGV